MGPDPKDRETKRVHVKVVENIKSKTLKDFVNEVRDPEQPLYTDDARAYRGLPNHYWVKHSVGEYVNEQAHTNGMESFWSQLKRGYLFHP